jgi:hypothetical protein
MRIGRVGDTFKDLAAGQSSSKEEKFRELHRKKREPAEGLLEGTDSAARLDIATMRELLSL